MQPQFLSIPLDRLRPATHQARTAFDPKSIEGLAESMRQEGQLQPVLARPVEDGFELISGERRLRAAKLLGWPAIDAKIVSTVSEAQAAAQGLIENLQRENLNPVDEAKGFKELQDLQDTHWTQERIAKVCGKGQPYVSRSLALLDLPEFVLENMRRRILTREHGVELLRVKDPQLQMRLAQSAIRHHWSVKKMRAMVERTLNASSHPRMTDPLKAIWTKLEEDTADIRWKVWFQQSPQPGWNIFVHAGDDPHALMARWLKALQEALSASRASDLSRPQPRLPRNAEEQAELDALAQRGPGAVYAWIWGEGSLLARTMSRMTWAETGARDAVSGCQSIVETLRNLPLTTPTRADPGEPGGPGARR